MQGLLSCDFDEFSLKQAFEVCVQTIQTILIHVSEVSLYNIFHTLKVQ